MSLVRIDEYSKYYILNINKCPKALGSSRLRRSSALRINLPSVPSPFLVATRSVDLLDNHEMKPTISKCLEKLELDHLNNDLHLNFTATREDQDENFIRKVFPIKHGFKPIV